jgi:hypothetical protein
MSNLQLCPLPSLPNKKKTATLGAFTHTFWQSHLHQPNPGVVMAHWYSLFWDPGSSKKVLGSNLDGVQVKPLPGLCHELDLGYAMGLLSRVYCCVLQKKKRDQSDGKLVLSYSLNGPPSFGARCNIPHSKTQGLGQLLQQSIHVKQPCAFRQHRDSPNIICAHTCYWR